MLLFFLYSGGIREEPLESRRQHERDQIQKSMASEELYQVASSINKVFSILRSVRYFNDNYVYIYHEFPHGSSPRHS